MSKYPRQARRYLPTNHPTWRRIREAHLAREPKCRDCESYYQLEVDHDDGDTSNNSPENLVTRCKRCHAVKTNRENGSFGRQPNAKRRGCDENGNPLDESHPWNRR